MTVTYIQHVHTAGKVGAFLRLLTIWKGGVAKGIWRDLLLYVGLYASISLSYRFGFSRDEEMKAGFERLCVFMSKNDHYIPLGFILGFYVTQVVNRFWTQINTIPWVDTLCMNLVSYLPGEDMKQTRRLITRWVMMSNILTLRRISSGVAKRFPTYQHLIDMKLMTEKEMKKLEKLEQTTEGRHAIAFYPIQWAQVALRKAKDEGKLSSDFLFDKLHSNLNDISGQNGTLLVYAWINIPLVYTQLVTIGVYIYFSVTLLGRQYLSPTKYVGAAGDYVPVPGGTPGSVNLVGHDDSILDFYVPLFSILQFIFYFGWLKVAETLINPFGEDDEDIDVNYIIDRNFQVGYLMVSGEEEEGDTEEDTYENQIPPATLPHTVSSYKTKDSALMYPTDNILQTETEEDMMLVDTDEADSKDLLAPSTGRMHRRTSVMSCSLSHHSRKSHSAIDIIRNRMQTLTTIRNTGEFFPVPVNNDDLKVIEETVLPSVVISEHVDCEDLVDKDLPDERKDNSGYNIL